MYTFDLTAWNETFKGLFFEFGQYGNSQFAIQVFSPDEGPFAKLTVAVEDVPALAEDEIMLKDWSENEALVNRLIELDLIEIIPGREVQAGFVIAKVAKMKGALAEEAREYRAGR